MFFIQINKSWQHHGKSPLVCFIEFLPDWLWEKRVLLICYWTMWTDMWPQSLLLSQQRKFLFFFSWEPSLQSPVFRRGKHKEYFYCLKNKSAKAFNRTIMETKTEEREMSWNTNKNRIWNLILSSQVICEVKLRRNSHRKICTIV